MPINLYIIFSKYNTFINIKFKNILIKKSLGIYGYKGKKKQLYYSFIISINKLFKNINLYNTHNLKLYFFIKGFNIYKNNIIKFIYKYFLNLYNKNLEFHLIDLTRISLK